MNPTKNWKVDSGKIVQRGKIDTPSTCQLAFLAWYIVIFANMRGNILNSANILNFT